MPPEGTVKTQPVISQSPAVNDIEVTFLAAPVENPVVGDAKVTTLSMYSPTYPANALLLVDVPKSDLVVSVGMKDEADTVLVRLRDVPEATPIFGVIKFGLLRGAKPLTAALTSVIREKLSIKSA